MPNIAHDLFLMITRLTPIKSKDLIIEAFNENLNNIFTNHHFEWVHSDANPVKPFIKVYTKEKTYGFIQYTHHELFSDENLSLFQNSIQLFGIILEKQEQDTILTTKKKEENKEPENSTPEAAKQKEHINEINEQIKLKLVENIGDVITVIDAQGINKYKSPNIKKLFGWDQMELIGKSTFDNVHPDDIEQCQLFFNDLLKIPNQTNSIELRYKNKKGHYSWIHFTACNLLHDDDIKGILGNYHDISDRKKQEQQLIKAKEKAEESENKYLTVFDKAPILISITDLESGEYLEVNNYAMKFSGFTKQEIIGKKSYDIGWISLENRNILVEKLRKEGTIHGLELPFKAKDGREVIGLVEGEILRYSNRDVLLTIMTDITKRKKIEEELIDAKEKAEAANRLKTEFLNNMSHEVRTPMNGIIGFSEMLDKPNISDEKRKHYSKIVQNSSYQLLRIIDDILEIATLESRQQKLNEEKLCLNELLMELFSIYNLKSKESNIQLYLKKGLADAQSQIISDKTKLSRILGNLIENALKFTSSGFIEIGYYLIGEKLQLYVKDTGIGISQENYENIFERFSQEEKKISRRFGGLGLGLSISRENAKLLGGDITLESEKERGSTFYVTIPYKPVYIETKSPEKNHKIESENNDDFVLLIAEDTELNYLYIETLFEYELSINYRLIHAKNGVEAVEVCKQNKNIDLVLMDIKMPLMNGHEAAKQIKIINPNLPIIAQTAYSTKEDKELAMKYGCDDFISKPLDKDEFIDLLAKYVNIGK